MAVDSHIQSSVSWCLIGLRFVAAKMTDDYMTLHDILAGGLRLKHVESHC